MNVVDVKHFAVDPTTQTASTTSYLATDASTTGVANYAGLVATKLYPGVSATLGGTMRMLVTSYRIEPGGSPATIRWAYQGADRVSIDPVVASLSIAVANGARTLSLGPPIAYQLVSGARVAVAARYVVSGTTVGVSVAAHDPRQPLFVTTELLHSHYVEASGTATIDGASYAVGASVRVTGAETGRDAYLAAIDPATGALGSTTFFVGSDDDEAHAVAASSAGILVAGATASKGFPGLPGVSQPQRPGGHDAFVLRLGDAGDIVAGSVFGDGDDHAATGVVESSNGDVILSGTTSDAATAWKPEAADFTTVLATRDSSLTSSTFFVAAFDNALDAQRYLVPFQAPPMTRIRAWISCAGDVMVGLPVAQAADCTTWPDLSYSMSQYGKDYAQDHDFSAPPAAGLGVPPGGFGYHALRWRYFEATDPTSPNYVSPSVALSFSAVAASVPKAPPVLSDAALLDSLEIAAFTPADPPGGWASDSAGTTTTYLGLTAAFAEWMYGSPTYTHRQAFTVSNNQYSYAINIEKTSFDVCVNPAGNTYAGQGLDTLCSFSSSWLGHTGCPGVIAGTGFTVQIKAFTVTEWNPILTWFSEHVVYDPFPPGGFYHQWYTPGVWICDPPDSDPQGPAKISEAVDRLYGLATVAMAAETTTYLRGAPQRSSTDTVTVHATDLR